MNRKLVISVFVLGVLAVGGYFGIMHAMREPNADDLERVTEGMTSAEVISILGKPNEIEPGAGRGELENLDSRAVS